ncbi:MAG: T9SS type A sorting domain-containing protein [Bacteroidales bacterium]
MKKLFILMPLLVSIFAFQTIGQTIYTDDFESYTVDQGIADQDTTGTWTTWANNPGSAEDPLVTDEASHGGTQSIVVEGTNDGVLLLNDLTENRYRVEFYLMIPENYVGYYNILQDFDGGNSTWGMQAFFQNGEGSIDGNGAAAATFSYTPGEWMKIQHFVDIDNDWIDFYVDDSLVHAYQWSLGSFGEGGINKLDAFNFYAWDDEGNETPKYFMDDYIIEQVDIPDPPMNLILNVENQNDVAISWDAPASGTPESYAVIRDGEQIATVESGLTYLDQDMYPNSYDYQVKAFYSGNGYSASAGPETVVVPGGNERNYVLLEAFTGVWCPYCPTAAEAIDEMAAENYDIAVINYHGSSDDPDNPYYDPYITPSTATRTNFYIPFYDDGDNSLGYPTSIINGMNGMEGAMTTVADQKDYYSYYYDEYIDIPTVYNIDASASTVSQDPWVFDINVEVEETFAYYNDEMRLHVALTETGIPESWQGMDYVNFVLRDMLPDANGTVLDFAASSIQNEDFQLTLDTTFVKDSCEVILFLQNMDNAYIMDVFKLSLSDFSAVEDQKSANVSVYPNPANDIVQVAAGAQIERIELYTVTGQKVLQLQPESNLTEFSVSDLTKGVYMMQLNTAKGNAVKKLIVK